MFKFLFGFFSGKKWAQGFFRLLHRIALKGMNYGSAPGDLEKSGELELLKHLKRKLEAFPEPVIFDVGANVGIYTLYLHKYFKGLNPRIYSFEPAKATFDKLRLNTEKKGINVYNIGFGSTDGKAELYSESSCSVLASLYQRKLDYFNINMDKTEKVEIRSLDSFCRESGIKSIDFLKLDIEGNELEALKGAAGLLKGENIRFIQFEFGGCNIDSRTFFKDFFYLLNGKYRIYRVLNDGLHLIDKYEETMEIFTTVNYFAERV